ncbi:MAG: TniB family NTP-binding protein [Sphingopyxis sp.]|nr:TniB family NTP-binding protein [Sphingopyxis sp.]
MNAQEIKRRIRAFEGLFIEHPRVVEAELAVVDLSLRQLDPGSDDHEILCTSTGSEHTFKFDDTHSALEEIENDLTQYCVLIVGEAGSGKTRLKDQIKARPEFKQDLSGADADIMPLLYFDMPNTPTPKALLEELCEKAGLVLPKRITRNELASKLRTQLAQIGTKLIIIDEAHAIVEGRRERAVVEAARCLKFLLNTCGVPMVLLGEEPLARLETSKALKRRIDCHISLDPYSWSYEGDRFEFLNYLDQLDEALGFQSRCCFADDPDISSRLYLVSGGHIGLVTKYLAKALKFALREGKNTIDAGLLAQAYRELHPAKRAIFSDPDMIIAEPAVSQNPFLIDRVAFKKMWATKFCQAVSPDTSDVVTKLRGSKKPQNVFQDG